MSWCVQGHAGENSISTLTLVSHMFSCVCACVFVLNVSVCVCAHVCVHYSLRSCAVKCVTETMNLRLFVNLKEHPARRSAPPSGRVCPDY